VAINTGSANALTGDRGYNDALGMTQIVADALEIEREHVLVLSTGVIGEPLPMTAIADGVEKSAAELDNGWLNAATAIMTTDTAPKMSAITMRHPGGGEYSIAGIAKGAGMIAPNMATMLAVIVTDAALEGGEAEEALQMATEHTFNRIVVDGDMSTNDTVLLLANGASGVSISSGIDLVQFEMALIQVCRRLALSIVRDGEGATRFISVNVNGAPDDESARKIANTIATSPLVKTAFYGGDANWGRILAAAGRAGVPFDPAKVQLFIAPGRDAHEVEREILLLDKGERATYDEAAVDSVMQEPEVTINLELNQGSGWSLIWTTDLSHDYVSINADYRT
jgi:glutamate N-acetyltransferase/amino-acid N-acetyltransferase